jgi:hypothetical protein
VKYTGDSGGIICLTKFLMQPTLHFRNLLCEIKKKYNLGPHRYGQNAIDVDWGIVVMLALAGKVTRRNLIQRIKPPEFNKNSKMFGLHSFF